jgi:hypothetical protein
VLHSCHLNLRRPKAQDRQNEFIINSTSTAGTTQRHFTDPFPRMLKLFTTNVSKCLQGRRTISLIQGKISPPPHPQRHFWPYTFKKNLNSFPVYMLEQFCHISSENAYICKTWTAHSAFSHFVEGQTETDKQHQNNIMRLYGVQPAALQVWQEHAASSFRAHLLTAHSLRSTEVFLQNVTTQPTATGCQYSPPPQDANTAHRHRMPTAKSDWLTDWLTK